MTEFLLAMTKALAWPLALVIAAKLAKDYGVWRKEWRG